ncbi:deformed epidermal autoregulatory factor 1-like isoform X2 [Galleria mellonella]|uniref:Deformed epidermal autoregulatory factor 1-like isoform X2 n=1 Tax=Galleria mellonella TaxID=7137 RepID=A0ABM3MJ98_GALME|nr:deformed epidermal autoregulatory factor 1-like isoform X2 [Galleria mellonella]
MPPLPFLDVNDVEEWPEIYEDANNMIDFDFDFDLINDDNLSNDTWQFFPEDLENIDYNSLENIDFIPAPETGFSVDAVINRLEDITQGMISLAGDFMQCIEEIRVFTAQQFGHFEQEQAWAQQAASVNANGETMRCANCNREATAVCSLCRRTPYCSMYCQKRDWMSHHIDCLISMAIIEADMQQDQWYGPPPDAL